MWESGGMSVLWKTKQKNSVVTGTWQKEAFQCSLLPPSRRRPRSSSSHSQLLSGDCGSDTDSDFDFEVGGQAPSRDSQIPVSTVTGYHSITHCCTEDRHRGILRPVFPEVLVRLPTSNLCTATHSIANTTCHTKSHSEQPAQSPASSSGVATDATTTTTASRARAGRIPGVCSTLQRELDQLASVDAYLAIYNEPEPALASENDESRVDVNLRFCFQFCHCLQSSRGNSDNSDSGSPTRLQGFSHNSEEEDPTMPVKIGLFEYTGANVNETTTMLQQNGTVTNSMSETFAWASNKPGKPVRMKSTCSLNLQHASALSSEPSRFAAVFSLCSGPPRRGGPCGCLMLHIFPRTRAAGEIVATAVRSEARLGPLLSALQCNAAMANTGTDDKFSPTLFHQLTHTLDALCGNCLRRSADGRKEKSHASEMPTHRDVATAATALQMAAEATAQFLPQLEDTSLCNGSSSQVKTSSDLAELSARSDYSDGDKESNISNTSAVETAPVILANDDPVHDSSFHLKANQHERLLRRREKWLAERFVALHTRERLEAVQVRERAIAAAVAAGTPVKRVKQVLNNDKTVIDGAAVLSAAVERQRAEAAAALQTFQTALLSRVDERFEQIETSLTTKLQQQLEAHMAMQSDSNPRPQYQSDNKADLLKASTTQETFEDRLYRRLASHATDFAASLARDSDRRFQLLQNQIEHNQEILQLLYGKTSVESEQNIGTHPGGPAPISASSASSPNSSFLIELPGAKHQDVLIHSSNENDLNFPESRNSESHPHWDSSGNREPMDVADQLILLRAKERELAHRESRLKLKEEQLRVLTEDLPGTGVRSDVEPQGASRKTVHSIGSIQSADVASQGSRLSSSVTTVHAGSSLAIDRKQKASLAADSYNDNQDYLLPLNQPTREIESEEREDKLRATEFDPTDNLTPLRGTNGDVDIIPPAEKPNQLDRVAGTRPRLEAGSLLGPSHLHLTSDSIVCEFCHGRGHRVGSNLITDGRANGDHFNAGSPDGGRRVLLCPALTQRQWGKKDILSILPQNGETGSQWRAWVEDNIARGCDVRLLLVSLARLGIYQYSREEANRTSASR